MGKLLRGRGNVQAESGRREGRGCSHEDQEESETASIGPLRMEMDLNLAYTRNRCVKSASVTGTVWGQRAGPRSPSMVKFGCSCSVVGALRVSGTGRLGDHCTFGCFGAGSRMDRGAGVAQGTGAGAFAAVLFRGNRLSPGGPRGAGEPGRNLGGRGCGTPVPRWPVRSGGTGRQSGQTRRRGGWQECWVPAA